MGALYFFASHMVIRTAFYLGDGRSESQMLAFTLAVLGAISASHVFYKPLLNLRLATTAYTGVPLVSVLASMGAILELVSTVPGVSDAYFYLGALFLGLAVGSFSVVLSSTITPKTPSPHHFRVPWSLVCAAGFYFLFRLASTVSYTIGEGFLLALPLVTLACTSLDAPAADPEAREEDRRSLQVLVWVSAAFAIVGSVVAWVAKGDVPPVESSVNYWTLFEVMSVAIMLACCCVLAKLAGQSALPKGTGAFVSCLCILPSFIAGCATAAAFVPITNGSLMWESSFWVLIVAIFSYDMRATPYSVDGIGVGIMFESMCVGQMATQVMRAAAGHGITQLLGVAFAVAYVVGEFTQLHASNKRAEHKPLEFASEKDSQAGKSSARWPTAATRADALCMENQDTACTCESGSRNGDPHSQASSLDESSKRLCAFYGLTEREELIFSLVASGRSASYISEELGISFNTVRTHIRHVYEKMGVHSKQELLDIVDAR